MNPDKILALARREIGTAATGQNNVKYNTAYYLRRVNGSSYAWCAVFLWWVFREAGAPELYFNGSKTASCISLLKSYRLRDQMVERDYQPGDIIFFDFNDNGIPDHVGLCESFDGTYITTIDGNTSATNEANGGTVARRKRHKKYICGAARPRYEEEEELTQEQFDAMLADWMKRQGELPASPWAAEGMVQAKEQRITDGTRPRSFATREEVAQMMVNAGK